MSAIVNGTTVRQLERPTAAEETITEADAKDAPRLARLLMRLLRDVATLKRRWWPRRIDFEDVAVDATGVTKYRLEHGFAGRVRWWPVSVVGGAAALYEDPSTDAATLVLLSDAAVTVTIRVEEAG